MGFFKKYFYILIAGFAVILVILVWGANYYFLIDHPERGTFGDMFGGVNALFSGFAFVGVIVAILMQSAELRLQREELAETRSVLKEQKDQLEAQSATFAKQNFENTFFELLRLHNDILNSIDLISGTKIHKGRDCFKFFDARVRQQTDPKTEKSRHEDKLALFKAGYIRFYIANQENISHYFRGLYNILKFVDSSEICNKQLYTNLVRSQLSTYELSSVFYNCISEFGYEKFYPLAMKYKLFKHLDENIIVHRDYLMKFIFDKENNV